MNALAMQVVGSPGTTPLDVMEKAQALIADRARWTQRVAARDANGQQTIPSGREAVQWDLLGALIVCCGDPELMPKITELLMRAMHPHARNMTELNDKLGHDAVIDVLCNATIAESRRIAAEIEVRIEARRQAAA